MYVVMGKYAGSDQPIVAGIFTNKQQANKYAKSETLRGDDCSGGCMVFSLSAGEFVQEHYQQW